jgi:[ribosomal protein S5]-alanine N-acetyltransferase
LDEKKGAEMPFADAVREFPVFTTKRLTLRQIEEGDAPAYYRGVSALPPTSTWPGTVEAQSEEKARNAIRAYNNYFKKAKTTIPWVLVDAKGNLVGFVKLFDIQNRSKAEIGYWLAEPHWGKGLMPEALQAVVAFAVGPLGLHRIYAATSTGNPASQRVLEKAGFTKEGTLRKHCLLHGQWVDSVMYGRLNTDR